MSTVSFLHGVVNMDVGDRVRILEVSKYRGCIGTIQRYLPDCDAFMVEIDDPRPFAVQIYIEHLERYEDPETFTADEFDSIFA